MNQVNTRTNLLLLSDTTTGGAAISCRRLRDGLVACGQDVRWIVAEDPLGNVGARDASRWPGLPALIRRRVCARLGIDDDRSRFRFNESCVIRAIGNGKGIINVHNIHHDMTFALIERLPRKCGIVWTLHDMWPLTGYCHYGYECEKYVKGCAGDCPQAAKWGKQNATPASEWIRRQRFFAGNAGRICLVCPSEWMASCARRRFNETIRVEHIPNGVDLGIFKLIEDKTSVRRALGLPIEQKIILAGAQYPNDPRKGTRFLVDAVKLVRRNIRQSVSVVIFGECKSDELPGDWKYVGTVTDERLLNLYYNAADVFVMPSLADNLPNTLVEAISAGTPCVTYDVGGCSEVIVEGVTGFCACTSDSADLALCMEKLLTMSNQEYAAMSLNCRKLAIERYALGIQARAYQKLFEEMGVA